MLATVVIQPDGNSRAVCHWLRQCRCIGFAKALAEPVAHGKTPVPHGAIMSGAALRSVLVRTFLLAGWFAACAAGVRAADPELRTVNPCGGQRGSEVDVTLGGVRLGDIKDLLWYTPGIAVKSVESKAKNQAKVHLAIAGDCRPGLHSFRVRTGSGISNLLTFSVGTLPEVNETEPNNDVEHAQAIPLGVTVNGVVLSEDVDYFAVDAKKGQRITAEIEGLRLGLDFFDPAVAILDARRFVVSGADDTPAAWQDSIASVVAPADGRYYVQVRESSYNGSPRCHYRLHVGSFPRPLAALPAGGPPGQTVAVQWLGDVAGPLIEQVALPAQASFDFGVCPQDPKGVCPLPLPLRVNALPNVLEKEPNNEPTQGTEFDGPAALGGVLGQPGDIDWFRFKSKTDQALDVRVFARTLRSPVDSVLMVRQIGGGQVAYNDDAGGPDSYARVRLAANREYAIGIQDQLRGGGPEYAYRIEVTPVAPQLTLSLPEREEFVDIVAPIPRGNRFALVVNAAREDFGGAIELGPRNLPPGVKAETLPMADGDGQTVVLFSADAAAPLGQSLVDLVGTSKVGNQVVEGRLKQRSSLVRGVNKREVWNRYADRLAAAVTEAVPFNIELVAPKAALPQAGSMNLKVVARRDKGYDEPITLQMLRLPPGVSSVNSVTLAKGQTEALIPLTADGSARVGKTRIAVLGAATVGEGQVTVATQLVDLDVCEPVYRATIASITIEQGKPGELIAELTRSGSFQGVAQAQLLGLPGEVTSEPRPVPADAKELVFPLKTTEKSPVGKHKSVLCQLVFNVNGETVSQTLGPGELRIVKPAPPKVAKVEAPKPAAKVEAAPPAVKRLSRLEQLRQARQDGK